MTSGQYTHTSQSDRIGSIIQYQYHQNQTVHDASIIDQIPEQPQNCSGNAVVAPCEVPRSHQAKGRTRDSINYNVLRDRQGLIA